MSPILSRFRWHAWLVPTAEVGADPGAYVPAIPEVGKEGEDLRHCPRSKFGTHDEFVAWLRSEMPSTEGRIIRIYGRGSWSINYPQQQKVAA